MKKRNSLGIGSQIFIYFLLSTGLIFIASGILLYFNFTGLVESEILKATRMGIDSSGKQLELYIGQVKDISSILAGDANICSYFEHSHDGHVADENDRSEIEGLISNIMAANEELVTIVMVGYDGKLLSNEPDLGMEVSKDMMEQQWYKDAIANSMPVLTSARMQEFTMDKDDWVLSLSREIVGECEENIGVLLIDFKYDVIEDILNELDLGSKGYPFILNGKNEVVYHFDDTYFSDEEKRTDLIELANMGNDSMEADRLIHSYQIKGTDWMLVGVASMDAVRMMRQDMIVVLWILGSAVFMIALGSGVIFSRRVSYPLRKLEKAMEEVESGKLEQTVDIRGSLEAESIAGHYVSMMKRIRKLLEEIQQKERYLRTSELNTLQSQINPHFLYNTLDTILWAAEFRDSDKVISLTKALARFFRLSLGGGGELTSVADELDHAEQYLFIQKQRYGDKLNYSFESDDGIGDIKIPRLILQPIVENAIYHGIRNLDDGGMISISVRRQEDGLLFTIRDNGPGYDLHLAGPGVGQANVDKRIKLYYGEGYGLEIDSAPGKGTAVYIKTGLEVAD
ncbi:MAG: sensor histidine kinase [Clostridia bacterium]